MKQYSDDLYQLIIKLSLPERRYCTLYLKKYADEHNNRYLLLFNCLKKQEAYNSTAAMHKIGFGDKPTHYSVLKKQLYERLLDAIHQFDLFSNPEQQLLRGIHQCELLLQKSLLGQCSKRIETLSKKAVELNHFEAQLMLQNLQMGMMARRYYRHIGEYALQKWNERTKGIVHQMEIINTYRYASGLMHKMQYASGARGNELANKMKNIVELPQFSDETLATNLRAKLDFYQVNALYCFTNEETKKALVFNRKFLAALEANPLMMQLHADRYLSVMNNYLIDCVLLKKHERVKQGLVTLRSLPSMPAFKKLINFEANIFRLGYLLEMNYSISIGDFTSAFSHLPVIEAGLEKYGEKIVKHNQFTLRYLMAYVCFALGKFDQSLGYLWSVLQEKEPAVVDDIQLAARMLQLLCHFEKGDKMLLESLARSIHRLLKRDFSTDMQLATIAFINSTFTSPKVTEERWKSLRKKIKLLSKNSMSSGSLQLFNYLVWVDAHIAKQTFAMAWK